MALKGIDVSTWQGNINWEKVKPNIDFAIIRAGFGSNIAKQDDNKFKQNADACTKLGIPFGVYLYSYAKTVENAKSEVEHVLRVIKGDKLDYPVYYDLEDANTTGKCSNAQILEIAKAFISIVEKAGYTVGVYANTYWWNTKLTDAYYNKYTRWVAQYAPKCQYKGAYDMWQYTSSGAVDGISGNVDMNYCYKEFVKPDAKPVEPAEKETYSVGDKVKITGAYASSAYSDNAPHTAAKGKTAYIVKIYKGTKYPYQLGVKAGNASSDNTIGFANEAGISEVKADNVLSVGDAVKIVGAYAESAYSTKASHTAAKGKTAYIVKIYKGAKFPYQIGSKKGDASSNNTIGFANAASISEI